MTIKMTYGNNEQPGVCVAMTLVVMLSCRWFAGNTAWFYVLQPKFLTARQSRMTCRLSGNHLHLSSRNTMLIQSSSSGFPAGLFDIKMEKIVTIEIIDDNARSPRDSVTAANYQYLKQAECRWTGARAELELLAKPVRRRSEGKEDLVASIQGVANSSWSNIDFSETSKTDGVGSLPYSQPTTKDTYSQLFIEDEDGSPSLPSPPSSCSSIYMPCRKPRRRRSLEINKNEGPPVKPARRDSKDWASQRILDRLDQVQKALEDLCPEDSSWTSYSSDQEYTQIEGGLGVGLDTPMSEGSNEVGRSAEDDRCRGKLEDCSSDGGKRSNIMGNHEGSTSISLSDLLTMGDRALVQYDRGQEC